MVRFPKFAVIELGILHSAVSLELRWKEFCLFVCLFEAQKSASPQKATTLLTFGIICSSILHFNSAFLQAGKIPLKNK